MLIVKRKQGKKLLKNRMKNKDLFTPRDAKLGKKY